MLHHRWGGSKIGWLLWHNQMNARSTSDAHTLLGHVMGEVQRSTKVLRLLANLRSLLTLC